MSPRHSSLDGRPNTARVAVRTGSLYGERVAAAVEKMENRELQRLLASAKKRIPAGKLRKLVERGKFRSSYKPCTSCGKRIVLVQLDAKRNKWKPFDDPEFTPHRVACRLRTRRRNGRPPMASSPSIDSGPAAQSALR